MPAKSNYQATDIKVLKGLEPVRKRPSMYIGSTDSRGLHHLVKEILDNAVDEALVGYGKTIRLYRLPTTEAEKKAARTPDVGEQSITVIDQGRGIPVEMHASGVSALEVVMTKLHAGGKFEETAYKASGGLHGIGSSAVNALSGFMQVVVKRGGKYYYQSHSKGIPQAPVAKITEAKITALFPEQSKYFITYKSGTLVQFIPDPTIFSTVKFSQKILKQVIKDRAYLMAGIDFHLIDQIKLSNRHYYFEGGIRTLVEHINLNKKPLHKVLYVNREWRDKEAKKRIGVEVAIQYNDSYTEKMKSYVNVIHTPDGGTHVNGFRLALSNVLRSYANDHKLVKDSESFVVDDLKEGMTAVVFVKMPSNDLQFESQTKTKLNNSEAQTAVYQIFKDALTTFLEENPKISKTIIEKVMLSARARMAARAAKDAVIRKGLLEGSSLPGKLADCQSREASESEIYIVEGDSAGGCFSGDTKISLVDGRNLSFKQIIAEQKQNKKHYCYTIRKNGKIGIEQIINPRKTKSNADVVKIILDNDEEIICTPDHKFMLRSGKYIKADQITVQDSLMPLYKKYSSIADSSITIDGYEMAWDPKSDSWLFTHKLADWYNLWHKKYAKNVGPDRHHQDFNKLNNNPDNIIRLSKKNHLNLHRKHIAKTLHSHDAKQKSKKAHRNLEYRKKISKLMLQPKMRQQLSDSAKKQWKDENYKNYMMARWKQFYQTNADYREKNKTSEQWTLKFRLKRKKALHKTYYKKTIVALKKCEEQNGIIDLQAYKNYRLQTNDKSLLKFDTFAQKYFNGDQYLALGVIANYNHKIKSVEKLSQKIDVYDIEVPNTHNFALASGVFVHNSAKQGRDRRFQAIFPLRGKILNTERARLDRIIASEEIKNLIIALGAGIGETFNIDKLRYHRIILMNDADVDGEHITTLGLTFFFRHLPEIIEAGYLYVAMPPLYKVTYGKTTEYVYTDEELKKLKTEIKTKNPNANISLQRYKGLGEMNPEQLWDTTMNPETRMLKKMVIEDAIKADHAFDVLMGDSVPPRKKFIQSHASMAELDV